MHGGMPPAEAFPLASLTLGLGAAAAAAMPLDTCGEPGQQDVFEGRLTVCGPRQMWEAQQYNLSLQVCVGQPRADSGGGSPKQHAWRRRC